METNGEAPNHGRIDRDVDIDAVGNLMIGNSGQLLAESFIAGSSRPPRPHRLRPPGCIIVISGPRSGSASLSLGNTGREFAS